MAKLFIYVASGVGFLAVALVLFDTCRKFINKRNTEDQPLRSHNEPSEYRASTNNPGGNEDDQK